MPDTDNNKEPPLKDIIPGAEKVHEYLKRFARARRHERINLLIAVAIAACLSVVAPFLISQAKWALLAYDLPLAGLLAWWLFHRIQKPVPKKPLGLLPYEDGELFSKLGRHNEIDDCLNLIKAPDASIVVVHGPPGSGKTSVLLGGIRFKLEHSNAGKTQPREPKCIYWLAAKDASASSLATEIERSTDVVCHGNLQVLLKSASKPIVLLIDQFERLQISNQLQKPIFDFIHEIGRQRSQVKLVIALRSESFAQWKAFEKQNGIRAPRIEVNAFLFPQAVSVMQEVLANAQIGVSPKVVKHFIRDMASEKRVSPVAIGLGASIFWKWHEEAGKVISADYITAGGSRAVLRDHLRERFNRDFIDAEEFALLIRALITTLVEAENGAVKRKNASLQSIGEATTLNFERLRLFLGDLVACRIVDNNATADTYTIAHERFVTLLQELDRGVPSRSDESIVTQYVHWQEEHRRSCLLQKNDIRRVVADPGILIAPPDEFQRAHYVGLSRRALCQKQFVMTCLSIAIAAGTLFGWKVFARYRLRQELKRFSLPTDLYDRQHQLESLVIVAQDGDDQSPKLDLDWLDSDSLTNLAISTPHLHSIDGISRVQGLQAVDVDLNNASTRSLHPFSALHYVRKLVLRNVGNAKFPIIPEIDSLPNLTDLRLDLHNSAIGSPPRVTTSPELKHLTLDLRSTRILHLPNLSQLQQLSTVDLFIDGSRVGDLSPLSRVPQLQALTISLDGTQTHLLSGLNNSQSLQGLALSFSSTFNKLPDLRGIHLLTSLSLHMPGIRGGIPDQTPVPDVEQLNNLKALEVFLNGSDVESLPSVKRLINLERLRLDLQGSPVKKLPDLSQLHSLQALTLNLNNTAISDLPDFAQFRKLSELDLSVAYMKIKQLHEIENLHTLKSLSLDLRGIESTDFSWIAKISTLDKLRLRLRWSQVGDLPDLCALTQLHSLELDLDDWWNEEELPKLSCLTSLTELILGLRNSHISALPNLSSLQHLTKLTLNLDNSDLQDLSSLETLTSLEELCLDIRRSEIRVLPNLTGLRKLRRFSADIGKSGISIRQTVRLGTLTELDVDESCPSVRELPQTVKKLIFALGKQGSVPIGSICERDPSRL